MTLIAMNTSNTKSVMCHIPSMKYYEISHESGSYIQKYFASVFDTYVLITEKELEENLKKDGIAP